MSEIKARLYVVTYWTDSGEDREQEVCAYDANDAKIQFEIKEAAGNVKVSVRSVRPQLVPENELEELRCSLGRLETNAKYRMPRVEKLAKDLYLEVRNTMEYLDVEWTT